MRQYKVSSPWDENVVKLNYLNTYQSYNSNIWGHIMTVLVAQFTITTYQSVVLPRWNSTHKARKYDTPPIPIIFYRQGANLSMQFLLMLNTKPDTTPTNLYYPIYTEQKYLDCDLDCNPENVPIYTGHALFNTTKCITLLFIVQSLLHRNPPNF